MTVSGAQVHALREAYREARAAIERTPDALEREIGLAALRLEAEHMYKQLTTTASGLHDEELAPLKDYVSNLTGGELPERIVAAFDARAEKYAQEALRHVWSALTGTIAVGSLSAVGAVFAGIAVAAQSFGASLFGFLIAAGGGVIVYAVRGAAAAAPRAERALVKSTGWAGSLGQASDRALGHARSLQTEIWRSVTGSPLRYTAFTSKVRVRAQAVVWLCWAAIAAVVLLVAIGFFQAASDWAEEHNNPTITGIE